MTPASLPQPIERLSFEAATLMAAHRPVLYDANKRVVSDIACPPGSQMKGEIGYSRWVSMALPDDVDLSSCATLVVGLEGFFDYAPVLERDSAIEWHVNFADPQLFGAYGSSPFAQDEMQVAEHPALGSLREALIADGRRAVTEEHGQATPVLITGVERRCRIATEPSADRPDGLYGYRFSEAMPEAIRAATTRIDPPTVTNLIAIAAPRYGRGRYEADEIRSTLTTAFTGFQASIIESRLERGDDVTVVVHTGYWGGGAFGGNRVLMALLQIVAAAMAGLDRLPFHTGPPGGDRQLARARQLIDDELGGTQRMSTEELIGRVEAIGFEWGASDGN